MSQIYKNVASSTPLPPTVPTQFNTDVNSPSIPSGNIEEIKGNFVFTDNIKGIQTAAVPMNSRLLEVQLTNRFSGTATTTDAATPTTVFTFSLGATAGTFLIEFNLVAYNLTSQLTAAYQYLFAVRTNGVNALFAGNNDIFITEEGAMSGVLVSGQVSMGGNSVTLTVNGLAGSTIHWLATGNYTFVS